MSFLLRRLYQVPPLLIGFVRALSPCIPRSSTRNDISSEDLTMPVGGHSVPLQEESGLARDRRLVTIDVLPDDILVETFYFCVNIIYWPSAPPPNLNAWHALVHVCRRWRYLVFTSPRHLNLRLVYEGHRPISEVLDTWPVLPVILTSRVEHELLLGGSLHPKSDQRWDNKVAALESEHSNRICEIHISYVADSRWERFAAAMEKPFPELTHLWVSACSDVVPVLSDSFLGGSAAHLRGLSLGSISFSSLPKLLLSANGLVTLDVWDIPDSGYFSPDAIATALTVMTRLKSLNLQFYSPRFRSDPASRPLPPPTRFLLPALTELMFRGVHGYLEDLLVRIDTPLLDYLRIMFFMDLNFDVPQLHRLICHTEGFKTFDHARLWISTYTVSMNLYPKTRADNPPRLLQLGIKSRELNWNFSSLAQLYGSSFPAISTLEELEIRERYHSSFHDIENTQWLEFLDSFIALKNLHLTDKVARRVCNALQELSGKRVTEVLPALRNLFIDSSQSFEHIQEVTKPFVIARQFSGRPVVIIHRGI